MNKSDFDNLSNNLAKKSSEIRQSQRQLHEELLSMETWVNKSLADMDRANAQLKDLLLKKLSAEKEK